MAKITKTTGQKVETSLDKFVELLKRNWDKVRNHFSFTLSISGDVVTARGFFNLTSITQHLNMKGLDISASQIKLGEAIVRIFREIESQNRCLKNMKIEQGTTGYRYLDISFDIVIAPVMPVEEPASPLTTALLWGEGNQEKAVNSDNRPPATMLPEEPYVTTLEGSTQFFKRRR